MKEVTAIDARGLAPAQWSQHLFMLDPAIITLNFVSRVIEASHSNIRSKNGDIALPAELWEEITQYIAAETKKSSLADHIAVKVTCLHSDAQRVLLRCDQADIRLGASYKRGKLPLSELNQFLEDPGKGTKQLKLFRPKHNTRRTVQATKNSTFDIILDDYPARFPCLFWEVNTSEFIRRFLNNDCSSCHSKRFEACQACRTVLPFSNLSCTQYLCPVCVSPEFVSKHTKWINLVAKPYLQALPNYRQYSPPTTREVNDYTRALAMENVRAAFAEFQQFIPGGASQSPFWGKINMPTPYRYYLYGYTDVVLHLD